MQGSLKYMYCQNALNIDFSTFYPLWVVVKQAWVVVKITEWCLEPTTPDQCGENPDELLLTYMYMCSYYVQTYSL